jgi:hypothetical protein
MNVHQEARLRLLALLFLLPGLAGLIISASMSTYYLQTLPAMPIPIEMRLTPRNIHGTIVYQTKREDMVLTAMEHTSVGVFLVGLGLGLVHMWKWGIAHAIGAEVEEDEYERESPEGLNGRRDGRRATRARY